MAARRTVAIILLLAGVVLLTPGTSSAVEGILDWHSDITVAADGSMTVTEKIKVRAEGDQIKRGIYRDFPTTYRDRAGNRVTIGFDLLSVERDGHPEPYHTESLSNGVRVYLGQKSVFLKPAEYTYTISYRTDRQLGFFENHDELYWNVTGNGWDFSILKASATVYLPAPVPSDALMMEGYVGPRGSQERSVTWEVNGPGKVRFASGRLLNSREGLTIVLGWPKGIVAEPDKAEKTLRLFADNSHLFSSLGGLLVLLIYFLLKAPTRLGRRVMDKVEGFKMYLSTAEEHRLEKLHPPDKTPELFEKYLPYALALEVDQEWSEKFADVLRRAAEVNDYSPGWYHGSQ